MCTRAWASGLSALEARLSYMPSGPPPPCINCEHLDLEAGWPDTWQCAAYPGGIPDAIMHGSTHDTVRPDQVGTAVFVQRF